MNNWEQICKKMIQPQALECDMEEQFIECWKDILGWDGAVIERQFPVQVGHETKRGDILLSDAIVVEVKKQGINLLDKHIIDQLKSYMRIRLKKFGMLLGDELWVLYDDYIEGKDDLKVIGHFRFDDTTDSLAIQLMDLVSKDNFNAGSLTEFCQDNWSGEYIYGLLGAKPKRATRGSFKESILWNDFLAKYKPQDNIINAMTTGDHNDICAKPAEVADKLDIDPKNSVQFGIARGTRPGMRKVEIRIKNADVYERYFAPYHDEIMSRINGLNTTGLIKADQRDKVICCYFPVSSDEAESHTQMYEAFLDFKKIILDYLLK